MSVHIGPYSYRLKFKKYLEMDFNRLTKYPFQTDIEALLKEFNLRVILQLRQL